MLHCTICIAAMQQNPFQNQPARTIYTLYPRDGIIRTKDDENEDEPDPQLPQLAPLPGHRFRAEPPFEPRTQRPRHQPRRDSLGRPQVALRNSGRVDLLPDPDGYGQLSPPPDRWPPKRRPPDLLPRRALFSRKVSPLRKQAKGISSKPTSSPAMTDRPVPHLLPGNRPQKRHPPDLLPRRVLCFVGSTQQLFVVS